jgi:cytolysin-activating lysine-acyltransferase
MAAPNMHLVAPAFGHLAASDAESFGSAVWLWMQAAKLHDRPLYALDRMLLPAIQLGQYVLVMEIDDAGTKRPIAYLGWANLSAEAEAQYVISPITSLTREDWNSGDRMWLIDFVAPFGNASKLHAASKPLFAKASARFMYHRSHERGVRVGHLVGTHVTSQDAHAWWKQRPILSVTKLATNTHNSVPIVSAT